MRPHAPDAPERRDARTRLPRRPLARDPQRRFLAAMPTIDERTVRHFTFYNPRERLVLAATAPVDGQRGDRRRWPTSRSRPPASAELGLVVDDQCRAAAIG